MISYRQAHAQPRERLNYIYFCLRWFESNGGGELMSQGNIYLQKNMQIEEIAF